MNQTSPVAGGADFVILSMSVSVLVAFIAVVCNYYFGAQRLILTVAMTAVLMVAYFFLKQGGYTTWSLIAEAAAFGFAYAIFVGLVERFGNLQDDLADRRTGHLRHGAAARPHLPRPRHHLHRPRHADRRRRHGARRAR
jgi:K+-sensing histidine kinase KdpD